MTWETMRQKVWALTRSAPHAKSATAAAAAAADLDSNGAAQANEADRPLAADAQSDGLRDPEDEGGGQAALDRAQFDKVRTWRRRVLLRKGAQKHAAMGVNAGRCSMAMLDATGVVISWYDPARVAERAASQVVDRHVSQFYVPGDIANSLPDRDLRLAAADGSSTQHGWRRRADGGVYWGTTVIDAVMLRDGRLQGFSHVTRRSPGPWENVPAGEATKEVQPDLHLPLQAGAFGFQRIDALS